VSGFVGERGGGKKGKGNFKELFQVTSLRTGESGRPFGFALEEKKGKEASILCHTLNAGEYLNRVFQREDAGEERGGE